MSIAETSIIDFISYDNCDNVILTISDHLDWTSETQHLLLLQEKINTYCRFVASGELENKYPDAKGKKKVICIMGFHDPSAAALRFFDTARSAIQVEGYRFEYKKLKNPDKPS